MVKLQQPIALAPCGKLFGQTLANVVANQKHSLGFPHFKMFCQTAFLQALL